MDTEKTDKSEKKDDPAGEGVEKPLRVCDAEILADKTSEDNPTSISHDGDRHGRDDQHDHGSYLWQYQVRPCG